MSVCGREAVPLRGRLLNLSVGGFCGQFQGPRLRLSDQVTVRISPVGRGGELTARARVAWLEEGRADGAARCGFSWAAEEDDLLDILALIPRLA